MDVLLERVEVQEGKHLVACVVGPVGGKHLLLDRAGIPVRTEYKICNSRLKSDKSRVLHSLTGVLDFLLHLGLWLLDLNNLLLGLHELKLIVSDVLDDLFELVVVSLNSV